MPPGPFTPPVWARWLLRPTVLGIALGALLFLGCLGLVHAAAADDPCVVSPAACVER